MKKTFLLLALSILFLLPLNVKAECNYERQAELSRIAANVQLSYTYKIENDNVPTFYVNVLNVSDDIYVVDQENNYQAQGAESTFRYTGGTAKYDIYSKDPNCYGEKLLTQYVTMPVFNSYSTSEECKEVTNFKYCQAWLDTEITEDEFLEAIKAYKNSLELKQIDNDNEENWLVTYFGEHYKIIIPALIVSAIIITLYFVIKRRRQL